MLRRSCFLRTAVASTSVPAHFVHAIDMAFYYPRFQPSTHVASMGIPEIKDAVALLQNAATTSSLTNSFSGEAYTRWTAAAPKIPNTEGNPMSSATESAADRAARLKQWDQGLGLLERGINILENLGNNAAAIPAVVGVLRPLYATRFEVLNGVEHLPRGDYARHCHVHKTVLGQSARLLHHDEAWDATDPQQLDTTCVILGQFVKSFCVLHPKAFHAPPQAPRKPSGAGLPAWSLRVGDGETLTLAMVMQCIDRCLRLAADATAAKHHDDDGSHRAAPQLQWLVPKLLLLKALLVVPLTGDMAEAAHCAEAATSAVRAMATDDGRDVPELGLFLLAQAEVAARSVGWQEDDVGVVDRAVMTAFSAAADFYGKPLEGSFDADGVVSGVSLQAKAFECQAYAACLRSMANYLMNAPRPPATSTRDAPVFLPGQLFSMNPLMTVAAGPEPPQPVVSDGRPRDPMNVEECRRRTGIALERGLQLNRHIFPDDRDNAPAAWTLLSMACMYADTRDYLYATGLFERALKGFAVNYGAVSVEMALLQKLRYEFLAGVGSQEEAATASHAVISLLKQLDAMPTT